MFVFLTLAKNALGAPFADRDSLKMAVDNCLRVDPTGVACCGIGAGAADCGAAGSAEMPEWDVSLVSHMNYLFSGAREFNANISSWDVRSLQNTFHMFSGCYDFNQDLSAWNLESLSYAVSMFRDAKSFDSDITNWAWVGVNWEDFVTGATAWLDKYNNCGHSCCSSHEVCSGIYPNSPDTFFGTPGMNGPPNAWVLITCRTTHPAYGSLGNCPYSLEVGASCQPDCSDGYMISGTSSCTKDGLLPATCAPNPCDASELIPNGSPTPCTNLLSSGSSCQPTCSSGYSLSGLRSCLAGVLTNTAVCTPDPCSVAKPMNGDMGNCPSLLASGQTCQTICNHGYSISGLTSCNAGTLTLSTCSPELCSASPDSTKDGSDGILFCSQLHGTIGGTTGDCTCSCDQGYGGSGCLTAGACSASSDSSKDGSDGAIYCVNGGAVNGSTGSCECTCDSGYTGLGCESALSPNLEAEQTPTPSPAVNTSAPTPSPAVNTSAPTSTTSTTSPPPPPPKSSLVFDDDESSASRYSLLTTLILIQGTTKLVYDLRNVLG